MSALHFSSLSNVALVSVASLMLSLGATAAYADNAEQIAIARQGAHVTTPHSARALYRDHAIAPHEANSSNDCVGGYRWTQRASNVHRELGQMALPLPCR